MNIGEGVAFAGLALGFLGLAYKITTGDAQKHARIFTRLDEVKQELESKQQNKDVCHAIHEAVNENLKEIKTDLKKLLFKNNLE